MHSTGELAGALLDEGSFRELGAATGSGDVATGIGTIDDRAVCLVSEHGCALSGDTARADADKIIQTIDRALELGCPVIIAYGSRCDAEPSPGLPGMIIRRLVRASGVVPVLSVIMSRTSGPPAVAAHLADFVIMVESRSTLLVNEPDMITTVTGEDVDAGESSMAHYLAGDLDDAVGYIRELLSYLPHNNLDDPPAYQGAGELVITDDDHALSSVVPDAPHQPYDVREVITAVLDDGELLEVQQLTADNVVVGFGRVDGRSVGVVANQPRQLAGYLDGDAAAKAARFVRTCDAFHLPVITFVDAPGILPDGDQERHGLGRRIAQLVYAYAEATVPLVTVTIGRAYAGIHDVMGGKQLGADLHLAWPSAQIAALGPQAAVTSRFSAELADAEDPDARRAALIAAYVAESADPDQAAQDGAVDAVIRPAQTRTEIIRALRLLRTKRQTLPPKKHGNLPL